MPHVGIEGGQLPLDVHQTKTVLETGHAPAGTQATVLPSVMAPQHTEPVGHSDESSHSSCILVHGAETGWHVRSVVLPADAQQA